MTTETNDEVLTLKDMCELGKCSAEPIKRAIKRGVLPGGKVGGETADAGGYRSTKRAFLAWVEAGMPGSEAEGGAR